MVSTAGHISRDLICFDFRRLVAACVRVVGQSTSRGTLAAGEDLTARAVAGAGLAALIALPFLLLSSVVLAAPLALPAAIGLGYLAVSRALNAQHRRRATLINAFVLCGLVGWLLLFLLTGEGQSSHAGLTAALMAPLFAAAPAFARSLISARKERQAPVAACLRDVAPELVSGLDELTLVKPVPVLDREGAGIAANPAARANSVPARKLQQLHRPRCDIGEAIAFALRHAEPKAVAKKVLLTSAVEPDIAAACDRQIGRRILHLLIDCGMNGSQAGGIVHVLGRRLKGVVLLRMVSAPGSEPSDAGESDARIDISPLRALIELAGGTLVVDREGHEIALSVRLDLAIGRAPQTRTDENAGAD